jgi:hypothetical protein
MLQPVQRMHGLLVPLLIVQLRVEVEHRNALWVVSMLPHMKWLLTVSARVLVQPAVNHVIQQRVANGSGSWVHGRRVQPAVVVVHRPAQSIVMMAPRMYWVSCVCSNPSRLLLVPAIPMPVLCSRGKLTHGSHVRLSVIMVPLIVA